MNPEVVKADFYQKQAGGRVNCRLCRRFCVISEGERGFCGARRNIGGELYSLVYGRPASMNVDPIEKKPLYHFLPGSLSFSFGTRGCNFRCPNCHNYQISQAEAEEDGEFVPPEEILALAEREHCASIAYTYNEPTIFAEYALDAMKLARSRGLKNIWVSNGFMSEECLAAIGPFLDAANIDLKSMDEEFYQNVCQARLAPVLDNLRALKKAGVHLEITTLLVPTLSDGEKMLARLAQFIAAELGADTAWHVSRFAPEISWKLQELPETSLRAASAARAIGLKAGLNYVYAGGVEEGTYCPACGELAVERFYYRVKRFDQEGRCAKCGQDLKIKIKE